MVTAWDGMVRVYATIALGIVAWGSLILERRRRERQASLDGWDYARWIAMLLLARTVLWGPL